MTMKQSTKDKWAVFFGGLVLLLVIVLIPLNIWAHVAAPCKYVDWMPAKDVPSRCLDVNK